MRVLAALFERSESERSGAVATKRGMLWLVKL
jgi:hypothetical protein